MRNWILIVLLLIGLAPEVIFAQWTKNISLSSSYDDNAYRNYTARSDYVTQLSGYLAKDSGGERWRWRLFYSGGYNIFAQTGERNYQYHQIGTAWSSILSDRGNALNLGINGSLRANGEVYDYYNFREASGYANVKLVTGLSSNALLGYRLRGRWYSNLPELSYTEHYFFARYRHSFQTRTTLIVEGNYGRKIYRQQLAGDGIDQEGDQLNMGDYGHQQGGMGRMWQRSNMGNSEWSGDTSADDLKPAAGQWVGQIRLAQSLSNSTGVSVDFLLRRNAGGEIRYLAGQASGYISEDELFDDRYGYESEELGTTLTQLMPWKATLKAGIESRWKDYLNRPALDLNGEVLPGEEIRKDRQLLTWISLSKPVAMAGDKTVNLFGEFYWIDNRSNDLYYDYQVSLVSIGIGLSF